MSTTFCPGVGQTFDGYGFSISSCDSCQPDPKPEAYGLPSDYTYTENLWGSTFHKVYKKMSIEDARAQCKSDGAELPIPRSSPENGWLVSLIPNKKRIWIGFGDEHRDSNTTTTLGYTNWHRNIYPNDFDPTNRFCGNPNDGFKYGIQIRTDWPRFEWTDVPAEGPKAKSVYAPFVCTFKIPGNFSTLFTLGNRNFRENICFHISVVIRTLHISVRYKPQK